jgi:hypothetical protein
VDLRIPKLRRDLEKVRHDHFNARTRARKDRCRERDAQLRAQIADLLRENGMPANAARALSAWDPYDQNHAATFFDTEWMFGIPVGKVSVTDANPATLRGNLGLINQVVGQMDLSELGEIDSGFDIVIGNPPYVRIQTLKQQDPHQVAFFKEHYESARKGNYDLYVVFVERGLQLLRSGGTLAYILPHKFFNAQYGAPLRGLLAKGRHLKHVVHFGDQQVFPGATNYVCLLFLSQAGADTCRFVRAENLHEWLQNFKGTEGILPAQSISATEWNFTVGRGSSVFEHLNKAFPKLGDTADLFVGVQTDADDVFIVEVVRQKGTELVCYSNYTSHEHRLEANHAKPLLKGSLNIRRFLLSNVTKRLVFPYETRQGVSALIPPKDYREKFPLTWEYLNICKDRLKARGNGTLGDAWYGYVYRKNHTRFEQPKLVVPSIAQTACFAADLSGKYYFVGSGGGGGGGYGVVLQNNEKQKLLYLLGILNSTISTYFLRQVSTTFRGGYLALNRQYIEQLPIVTPTQRYQLLIVRLVDYLLWLHEYFASHAGERTARDELMSRWWEQVLNGLVYELYFSEELHARSLRLFDLMEEKVDLPDVNLMPESTRLSDLRSLFETVYESNHPLRGSLHTLRSLETVRIIEGEP